MVDLYHKPTGSRNFPKRASRFYVSLMSMSACLCISLEINYKALDYIIVEARNPKSKPTGSRAPMFRSSTRQSTNDFLLARKAGLSFAFIQSSNGLVKPTDGMEDNLFLELTLVVV